MKPDKKADVLANYLNKNGQYDRRRSEDRRRQIPKTHELKKTSIERIQLHDKNRRHRAREVDYLSRNCVALFKAMAFTYK